MSLWLSLSRCIVTNRCWKHSLQTAATTRPSWKISCGQPITLTLKWKRPCKILQNPINKYELCIIMPCIGWCRLVWLKKNVEVFSQWQVHRMVSFALLLLRDFLHGKLSLLREKEWSAAAHNGHLRQQQSYCILLKHQKYIQLEACEADFTVLYFTKNIQLDPMQ